MSGSRPPGGDARSPAARRLPERPSPEQLRKQAHDLPRGARDGDRRTEPTNGTIMTQALLDTWSIHDRINRYVLDAIAPDALLAVSASKGRNVGEQFAHMHNVRLMWLKQAAPPLLKGLEKIEKPAALDHDLLRRALERSGTAMETLLREAFDGTGRIKGFKPHAAAFLGYLISHESHHRGQIALSLKQAGHPLDKKTAFGIWEWGVR